MLLFLGFLSLLQIMFLPGFLCLRAFRLPTRGVLQPIVYSFGLTLLTNYLLIYALQAVRSYSPPVLYLVIAIEFVILFRFLGTREPVTIPSKETLARYDSPGTLAAALPALASILALGWLCYTSFGSVFLIGDDVVSWDRFAIEWSQSRPGHGTGYYPQLLPANWSIPYVMMQTTEIKMFAKAIMPLFALFTALLFLDMFHKTGEKSWLLGLSCYAFLLRYFFNAQFISSGYVEVANAFFAFLTLYACLQVRDAPADRFRRALLLVAVFASATLLVKQGGVLVFVWALGWLGVQFARSKGKLTWRFGLSTVLLVLALNWWYVVKQWEMWRGIDRHNLVNLTQELHFGRTYSQRWTAAFRMLERIQLVELAPLFWLACGLVLLSIFHRQGRLVLLTITAPFYVLWALLFSYEARTLALDLPFAGYCCGCGLALVLDFLNKWIERLAGPWRWVSVALLAVGLSLFVPRGALRTVVEGFSWNREFGHTIRDSLVAGSCALLLIILGRRFLPVNLRMSRLLAIAGLCAVTIIPAMTLDPDQVIRDQCEKRRQVGVAGLNRKIYDYAAAQPIEGKILTDYWFLDFAPELRLHAWTRVIPQLGPETLQELAAAPGARYVLTSEGKFPTETQEWMKRAGFEVVFRDYGYEFIRFPRPALAVTR